MKTFKKEVSAAFCLALASGVSTPAIAQPGGNLCKVTVDRSQPSGVYDVTRVVADDGDCVCYVYTGPQTQGQGVEGQIAALMKSKSCADAKTVNVPKSAAGGAAGAGGAGWAAAGAAAAFGAFVAVAADDADDDNPVSP